MHAATMASSATDSPDAAGASGTAAKGRVAAVDSRVMEQGVDRTFVATLGTTWATPSVTVTASTSVEARTFGYVAVSAPLPTD